MDLRSWPWPEGVARPVEASPLTGGMICTTARARLDDGAVVVAKACGYDPEVEADGLTALRSAGAAVPRVLGWARPSRDGSPSSGRVDAEPARGTLVMEHVDGPEPSHADWASLGTALADLHRSTAQHAARDRATYGWERDNRIGVLVQHNAPVSGRDGAPWAAFYAERRVRSHLHDPSVPRELASRLARACDGPLRALLPPRPPVSLIHGDLWSGNVIAGRWLVDPAVQRADRELELAYMTLFGGFPTALHDAYQEAWPPDDGWEERRPALQLHHLLVHVRHFERRRPGPYVRMVADRLAHYGW